MYIKLLLNENDDRVISIDVVLPSGEQYAISAEFLDMIADDEVQISVRKLINSENGKKGRSCPGPNAIVYNEEEIAIKRCYDSPINANVWFEFHKKPGLPHVSSKD